MHPSTINRARLGPPLTLMHNTYSQILTLSSAMTSRLLSPSLLTKTQEKALQILMFASFNFLSKALELLRYHGNESSFQPFKPYLDHLIRSADITFGYSITRSSRSRARVKESTSTLAE